MQMLVRPMVGRSEDSFDFSALTAFSISKLGRDDVGTK